MTPAFSRTEALTTSLDFGSSSLRRLRSLTGSMDMRQARGARSGSQATSDADFAEILESGIFSWKILRCTEDTCQHLCDTKVCHTLTRNAVGASCVWEFGAQDGKRFVISKGRKGRGNKGGRAGRYLISFLFFTFRGLRWVQGIVLGGGGRRALLG
eukprot:1133169-Amorphochlora_amoeboformis.AAC.1